MRPMLNIFVHTYDTQRWIAYFAQIKISKFPAQR